jgi:hypothetical protein
VTCSDAIYNVADLFLVLIHYPCLDRQGRIVTTAITSLDLHDIVRSARTFGVRAVYVANPVREQREFAARVRDHWFEEPGRKFDSRRREALELMRIVDDLDQAVADVERVTGRPPVLIYTSAHAHDGMGCEQLRARIDSDDSPVLLMFGTGFGLAPAVRERADVILNAIEGGDSYNHLSVRAAVAIFLDRLRGR